MDLNIIKAKFCNNKKSAWTDEQWQWDYGQILVFEGLELPEAYEVHFSNIAIGGESITQIGTDAGVTIPDQFFTTGETIYAWVYLHQGEDDGETVYSVTIPVKKRPQPSDTPPTPQEQSAIDQAIAALNAAVEQTAEDVETTTENAEQAAASAENAATSAEEASGYLEGVTAKANEAAASASAAAQSATTASQKAAETAAGVSRAEQAAENAEAAETGAQTAQAAAEAAVGRAESYAGEASRSAQAASTSATQAAGSATSASGFAGDANTSAQAAASMATTASTKATEAAQSASTASTAATNAINAKTAAETAQGKAEDAQEAAETAQEAAETAVESIQGKSEQIDQNTEDIGDLKAEISQLQTGKADIIISSASGTVASFLDGADGLPMESVVAHIEPVQSGTGDPSPTNIRPISGWTQAKVTRTGKNLFNRSTSLSAKFINSSGEVIGTTGWSASDYIEIKDSCTYTLSGYAPTGTAAHHAFYDANKNFISSIQSVGNNTFVSPSGSYYVRLSIRSLEPDDAQLEIGPTATTYEIYKPIVTATIDLNGTVYGGYVDAVKGKLVVDRVYVDLGALRKWEYSSTFNCYFSYLTSAQGQRDAKITFNAICSQYPFVGRYSDLTDKSCAYIYNQAIAVRDSSYLDVESFKTAMSGVQLVYELATPIEYDITPQEIASLLGVNNVWSDTGDTDVTYRADTKLYLESHIPDVPVKDVQVNGTSIVNQGVANVPMMSNNAAGVALLGNGLSMAQGGTKLTVDAASSSLIKSATEAYRPIAPAHQHESTFYGLAKAASDTTQSSSSNPVGTYTDAAKVAIQKMLGLNQQGELIADVTTTEDMTRITINTDINGEAFRLRKMIAIFEAPPSTTGARDTLRCELGYVNMQDANASTSTPAMQFPTATSQMMAKITVEAEPGIPISIWTSIGNSEGNSGNVASMPKPDIAKAIRAFSVYQSATTQSLVPSGSRMRIYGIRA